jgi:hypothetical protein
MKVEKTAAQPSGHETEAKGGASFTPPAFALQASTIQKKGPETEQKVTPGFPDFMSNLEHLEKAAIADGYGLTKRITAFRKLYYNSTTDAKEYAGSAVGGGTWNILIPGAAKTGLPPSWSKPENAGAVTAMKGYKEITINGKKLDFGHMLTGLDAGEHPAKINLALGLVAMRSNKEAATFVGDLGSVAGEYIRKNGADAKGKEKSFYDTARKQSSDLLKYYTDNLGAADEVGNADAYALVLDRSKTFAQNLQSYYSTDKATKSEKRFTKFAQSIGFMNGKGGFEYGIKSALQTEVMNAAQAYMAGKGRKADVALVAKEPYEGSHFSLFGYDLGTPTFWEMYHNVSGWTVDIFLERLKSQVQGEK